MAEQTTPNNDQPAEPGHFTSLAAEPKDHGKLGQLAATAICGNDITSSCLYVSALSIIAAGKWAPLSLLIVAGVLFLFRRIYAEVVGALPLNGGAYNALLNTTSKSRASIAACLTILSYMATAVISAVVAIEYAYHLLGPETIGRLESMWPAYPQWPVIGATIALLAVFMGLTILGITESSRVAIAIFITHMATLALLLVVGVGFLLANGPPAVPEQVSPEYEAESPAMLHMEQEAQLGPMTASEEPPPEEEAGHFWTRLVENFRQDPPGGRGFLLALFFGFSAAMLGISGFESSANFVEEQKRGVFPKTLRNMWIAVSIINPLMAMLALALVPALGITESNAKALLGDMGQVTGGGWLKWLISVDATLVLSGAVLTSYVGVNGLVHRMTLDRCLPQFLLRRSRRGTTHRIIIAFFLLAVSVLFITAGNIKSLAGVYTISFLSVMALFGLGNVLLKVKRAGLPRPTRAPWVVVLVGIAAVVAGILGNIVMAKKEFYVFLYYFIPALLIVTIMLTRITLLTACLFATRTIIAGLTRPMSRMAHAIREKIDQINAQQVVFFTRGDNVANLNNAVLYVQRNEHTNRVKVVTVVRDSDEVPARLAKDLEFLNEAYPNIEIEFVIVEGRFGPELIGELSAQWHIPTNLMFIGSPRGNLAYTQAELGGVRVII